MKALKTALIPDQTTILEKIPLALLVMDSKGRLRPVNDVLAKTFGIARPWSGDMCVGEALSGNDGEGSHEPCGRRSFCNDCLLRKTAAETLARNQPCNAVGVFYPTINGQSQEKRLLFQAVPFTHEGEGFVLLSVNDLSRLALMEQPHPRRFSARIIGDHPSVGEMLLLLDEAARTTLPVLLQGESGTGKELAARDIHDWSGRREKPFIVVNCGALPPGLLENELFGHVKGAFTDAIRDKKGRFELADGGTIFLDEIGELAPELQVKLLRVLQEGCFEPLGGTATRKVNVRLISATNKNLPQEVQAGRFRLDLFYRLCVVPITLPPLRERASDIPLLADHFLIKYDRDTGVVKRSLSPSALEILMKHRWPGNIRELQNVIQFAMMKSSGPQIRREHLPAYLAQGRGGGMEGHAAHKKTRLTKREVLTALAKNSGNKLRAAKELGVARATFYRFIKNQIDGLDQMANAGQPGLRG